MSDPNGLPSDCYHDYDLACSFASDHAAESSFDWIVIDLGPHYRALPVDEWDCADPEIARFYAFTGDLEEIQ